MERIESDKEYSYLDIYRIINDNYKILGNLPIHEEYINKYSKFISYFPFSKTKEKVYLSLKDKKERMGMLNRHVLSVARKIGISQVIIKRTQEISDNYRTYKEYSKNNNFDSDYWEITTEQYRQELVGNHDMILDMIFEEIEKRNNVKYLRKKKLEEIYLK